MRFKWNVNVKTVIARFAEVKELVDQGLTSGTDDEGEIIDVNKIQTALRTVGISMDDFFSGAEGLDQVLLRLSEKWDTLDFKTQRYISTTAAGSRQQSRFIAMISDYARTMELTTAAYDSAGAAEEQFGKTTESLQTKLQNLTTAWQEFTTGIANSDVIKAAVDALTGLLNAINGILDKLSGSNSILKSFVTILGGVAAFKGVNKAFNNKFAGTGLGDFIGLKKDNEEEKDLGNKLHEKLVKARDNAINKFSKETSAGKKFTLRNLFGKSEDIISDNQEEIDKIANSFREQLNNTISDNASNQSDILKADIIQRNFQGELDSSQVIAFAQAMRDAGYSVDETNLSLESFQKTEQNFSADLSTTADTLRVVGIGLAALTSILVENEKISKKTGEALTGVAGALIALPTIINTVTVALKAFGIAAETAQLASGPIGWAIAAIIATISIVNAVIETQTEKTKRLKEELEEATNKYEEAKNATEEFKNSLEEIDSMKDTFNDMVPGTEEYLNQLDKINSAVQALIDKYPELIDYIKITDNGIIDINEEGRNTYKRLLDEEVKKARKEFNISSIQTAKDELATSVSESDIGYSENNESSSEGSQYYEMRKEALKPDAGYIKSVKKFNSSVQNALVTYEPTSNTKYNNAVAKFGSEYLSEQLLAATEEEIPQILENYVNASAKVFKQLNNSEQDILTAYMNGGSFTKAMLNSKPAYNKSYAELGITQEDFSSRIKNFGNKYDEVLKKLGKKGIDLTLNPNLELDTLNTLNKQIENLSKENAVAYGKAFNKAINSADNAQAMANILSTVDLTSLSEINDALDYMRQQGLDESVIRSYWETAVAGGQAYYKTLNEVISATATLQEKSKNKDELFNRFKEGKATQEDYNELIKNVPDAIKYISVTDEGFTIASENLATVIEKYTQAIIDEAKTGYIGTEQRKQNLDNNSYVKKDSNGIYSISYDTNGDVLYYGDLVSSLGLNVNLEDYKTDGVLDKEDYKSAVKSAIEDTEYFLNNYPDMIRIAGETVAAVSGEYSTGAGIYGSATLSNDKKTTELNSLMDSTDGASIAYANLKDSLNKTGVELSESEKLLKNDDNLMKAIAIDTAKAANKTKEFNDKCKELSSTLTKENRGTQEYQIGLESFGDSFKDSFGIDLSGEFLQSNAELIEEVVAGNSEANARLMANYAKSISSFKEMTQEDINNLAIALGNLPTDIEIGATVDVSDAIKNLEKFGLTAEQIAKVMASLGYDVKFDYRDVTIVGGMIVDGHNLPEGVGNRTRISVASGIYTGGGGITKTDSSGGGSSKKSYTAKYEKPFNNEQKLAQLERERTNLQDEYNNALNDQTVSASKLLSIRQKELQNLKDQKATQQARIDNYSELMSLLSSKKYIDSTGKETTYEAIGATRYAQYNTTTQQVEINWEEYEKIADDNLKQAVDDYISALQEGESNLENAVDGLAKITYEQNELLQEGEDELISLKNKIYDAVVQTRRQQIEELQSVNDSINETNSSILDSIQKSIDLQRQIRDNTETEKDISAKESRLAYLKRDTSNANALEIKLLEKEIEDARQSYSDTLIDQELQRISDTNDEAAKQRERQIELLTNQLDYDEKQGAFWTEVTRLMLEGLSEQGLINGSELAKILGEVSGYSQMSDEEKNKYLKEIATEIKKANEYSVLNTGVSITERFAEGGFSTSTGPAWLDGTKVKPEWILNPEQTRAFIDLLDIPAKLRNGISSMSQKNGDFNCEINIQVEKIDNDYDVDRLAQKLREEIVDSSSYRNFNNINFMR